MLYRLAFRLVRDKAAAEDLVQDVFFQVWKNRDSLDWGPAMQSYLYKATTHAALNYLESNKRKTFIHQQIQKHTTEEAEVDSESVTTTELQAHIQRAIDRLPPKCRVIFLLNREEGLKYKQIAEQLDLSLKTVENQMGIALEKLRQDLKPFISHGCILLLCLFAPWLAQNQKYFS